MTSKNRPSHRILNRLTKFGSTEFPRHKDGNRLGIKKRIATARPKPTKGV